jgi:hypothetical protein
MADGNDAFEDGPSSGSGRGRSNGNGSGGAASGPIDPASIGPGTDNGTDDDNYARDADGNVKRNKDGSPQRKRGRKSGSAGSRNATGGASRKDDLKGSIDALTNILALTHMGIATVSNTPEMALSEDEAKLLANAAVPVLEQFDFKPDPRFTAVFGLVVVAGQIYVPRAVLIRMRKAEERAARAKPVYESTSTAHQNDAFEGLGGAGYNGGAVN